MCQTLYKALTYIAWSSNILMKLIPPLSPLYSWGNWCLKKLRSRISSSWKDLVSNPVISDAIYVNAVSLLFAYHLAYIKGSGPE